MMQDGWLNEVNENLNTLHFKRLKYSRLLKELFRVYESGDFVSKLQCRRN